jgi:tetratricopeptide (TPR) repeat protein
LLLALFGPSRVLALTDNPQAQAALDNAQATWDRNEDDQALQLSESVVKDFPDTEQGTMAQAVIGLWWKERGDLATASHIWYRVAQDYPGSLGNAEVWALMGATAEEQGHYGKACVYWDRVIRRFPGTWQEARARFWRAGVRSRIHKRYDQAIRDYERTVALAPEDEMAKQARLLIGHNYLWAGDGNAAVQAYLEVTRRAPGTDLGFEARYYLGFVLGADDPQAAVAHFEAVLRSGLPESFKARALLWRAGDYLRMKDYPAAERDCLAILSVASAEFRLAHPLARVMLGDIYVDQKRYDEAIAEFELIMREYPGSPVAQATAHSVEWVRMVRALAEQGWVAGEGGGQK